MPSPKAPSFNQISRLAKARAREFSIISHFKYGYRNKEDITNLPPGVLVAGSQNVLTNASDRVASRQGYVLDGAAADPANIYPIDSNYDFQTHNGQQWNLRKWYQNLEYKYTDASGNVQWVNLMGAIAGTALNAAKILNFAPWWDGLNEFKSFLLFVNGDNNIYEWSGGVGLFASANNVAGQVTAIVPVPANAGSGYATGDILTLATGTGATVQVTSVSNVGISSITVTQGNISAQYPYVVGQILGFAAGGLTGCTAQVTSIDGNGAVTGLTLISTGIGTPVAGSYTLTNTFADSYSGNIPGRGAGCQITVVIGGTNGVITGMNLITPGSGYSANTTYATTTGGAGTGATITTQGVASLSLTIQGGTTTTAAQLNFYTVVGGTLNIGSNQYTYSGVVNNTFFNLSRDASADGIAVGAIVSQAPKKFSNQNMVGIPKANYTNDLIATLNNQVYVGSLTDLTIYVSKYQNYQDYSFATPRNVGDGFTILLDEAPTAFQAQDNVFYAGTQTDYWYTTTITTTVNATGGSAQTINTNRSKTTKLQGPRSQAMTARMKNLIVYISYETIINTLGFLKNLQVVPTITNISDPIRNDIDSYDFTDSSIFYFNYYLYISVPKESRVLVYNILKKYWEAPQLLPIGRFYVSNGQLCGHSYLVPESYTLFTGYNDNGNPINAIMALSYQNAGTRANLKSFDRVYVEGYISSNTTLTLTVKNDFGGSTSIQSFDILGTDGKIIFETISDGSIGKAPLGKNPLGSIVDSLNNIPKFRVIKTFVRQDVFEYQLMLSSNDVDQQWELLAIGDNVGIAPALPAQITE